MTFALKNDVLSLEYPIKFFISQCLHNGIAPLWFDTWALGFPLESIITWSAFSPIQFWSSLLFKYNLYTLHAEFVLYVALSGCFMYHFLVKHICQERQLSLVLSACYMLSGFNVGSSQWLLYITASCFTPLIFSCFIDLLKKPNFKTAAIFSIVYYTMLTSVYAAFNIVIAYLLITLAGFYIISSKKRGHPVKDKFIYLGLTAIIITALATPALYGTLQVLNYLERGIAIVGDKVFFSSNNLPPETILSTMFPFSSVKNIVANTEATMFHCYLGLFPLLFLPTAVYYALKEKALLTWSLLLLAILFLLVSFGTATPLREKLNVLPGFSFFRNAGLFRLYFIFFVLVFVAKSLPKNFFKNGLNKNEIIIPLILFVTYLSTVIYNFNSLLNLSFQDGIKACLKQLSFDQTITISALIQLFFISGFIILRLKKGNKIYSALFLSELIINTLLCTPFFTVSSYSVGEVEKILNNENGFDIQKESVGSIPTNIKFGDASFENSNVFRKKVSSQPSYWGPLVLKTFRPLDSLNANLYSNTILFTKDLNSKQLRATMQKPGSIRATIVAKKSTNVTLLQNFYPGWLVKFNGHSIPLEPRSPISVTIPKGGEIEFTYSKKTLWYSMVAVNLLVLFGSVIILAIKIKQKFFISSSLSSPFQ